MSISLTRLQRFYGHMRAELLLHAVILREFPGTIGLLAQYNITSLLLLSMTSKINASLPVLLLESEREMPYLRDVVNRLGFTDLHVQNSDDLGSALETTGWLAVITHLTAPESIHLDENGVFCINPLARWSKAAQKDEMIKRHLPLPAGWDQEDGAAALADSIIASDAPNWDL